MESMQDRQHRRRLWAAACMALCMLAGVSFVAFDARTRAKHAAKVLLQHRDEQRILEQKYIAIEQQYIAMQREVGISRLAHIMGRRYGHIRDDFMRASAIRNDIYHSISLQATPEGYRFDNVASAYLESTDPEAGIGHVCGGHAIFYIAALEATGIPARYVGIFSRKAQPYDSHATVEFYYKGKWIASDPSFNAMFMEGGQYMSYADIYHALKAGRPFTTTTNGFSLKPERPRIETYYIPLKELMQYVVFHPARTGYGANTKAHPAQRLPASWDGTIAMQDGHNRPVTSVSHLYRFLGGGPVR